jgi:hypothetical protein
LDGSENAELSYSHAGLDGRTGENPQPGDEGVSEDAEPVFLSEDQLVNGYAISATPEDRREPEPAGQVFARVTIREIRHPAISSGPDDDLADFAPL